MKQCNMFYEFYTAQLYALFNVYTSKLSDNGMFFTPMCLLNCSLAVPVICIPRHAVKTDPWNGALYNIHLIKFRGFSP
jgi:hypothetical protein